MNDAAYIKALLRELAQKGKKEGAEIIAELRRMGYSGPEVGKAQVTPAPEQPKAE